MMYIDAHAHGMHAECDADGNYVPPLMMPDWQLNSEKPQELINLHNQRGIEKILLLESPEITFGLKDIFGDFIIPIPQIDMDNSSPEEIEELFNQGAKGIKFIAPMHSYGDNRYFPLYDVIHAHNALAIFHSGYLAANLYEPGCVMGREDYIDITTMRPAAIDRVARAFPKLKILMAHFGNPWWEEAWTILKNNKNIYADFSGGTGYQKSMSMWREMFAPNGRLHIETVSKLCFATDDWYFSFEYCGYQKIIDFYNRFYEELQLSNELRQMINHENIQMLLKT